MPPRFVVIVRFQPIIPAAQCYAAIPASQNLYAWGDLVRPFEAAVAEPRSPWL